jgi:hypothetical protein
MRSFNPTIGLAGALFEMERKAEDLPGCLEWRKETCLWMPTRFVSFCHLSFGQGSSFFRTLVDLACAGFGSPASQCSSFIQDVALD